MEKIEWCSRLCMCGSCMQFYLSLHVRDGFYCTQHCQPYQFHSYTVGWGIGIDRIDVQLHPNRCSNKYWKFRGSISKHERGSDRSVLYAGPLKWCLICHSNRQCTWDFERGEHTKICATYSKSMDSATMYLPNCFESKWYEVVILVFCNSEAVGVPILSIGKLTNNELGLFSAFYLFCNIIAK